MQPMPVSARAQACSQGSAGLCFRNWTSVCRQDMFTKAIGGLSSYGDLVDLGCALGFALMRWLIMEPAFHKPFLAAYAEQVSPAFGVPSSICRV